MAIETDEMIEKLLNDPKFISALANKIYDKLKDEVVIKKLEENSSAIKSLEETVKKQGEILKEHGEAIKSLQEAIKSLQETVKQQGEILKEHGEAIKSLQEAIKQQGEAIKGLQEAIKQQGEILKEHEEAIRENSKLLSKLATEIGSFTSRAGRGLERTIMMVYKEALELHGINPNNVKHGSIVDTLGIIDKGRIFEVDFYETDDYVYVFEVKNFADEGALEQILIRKKLIPQLFNKPVKLFLIANYVEKKIKEELEKEGVTIITSIVVE
ncbi:hypothetical protein BFU36_11990 [Sulfolobus sp. A20]|uniref:hypothetical protein n=1 Tax=Saccharolobus sp. A20 TaxID=1891280 RepID=UPI000845D763|nr:hypothetical protein [Sulfolobus sp. A20]TRM73845.1 hypothetical protein DJ523_06335 [Sulfolobus sp. E5]TRM83550.1 hypothetical protein DJ531_05065 [Sulfolobus sp. A20-N-F6]TRM86022.1 hypothetical protein DJ521_06520 [Sulfolobus sp. E3]TRM86715.1 hypothetical protein DJ529_10575 [Sulfolobus sp. C3]TRN03897.1 hypothetical protein DJ530_02305 [Sulfolobus sp. E1]